MSHSRRPSIQVVTLIAVSILAACTPTPSSPTQAGTTAPIKPNATAKSLLHPSVPLDSLRGVGIQIWHPWFGAEASLLDSQIAEFNKENEWGITVRGVGNTGYTELYNGATAALGGDEAPQLVVGLSEHALAWDAGGYVVDLNTYVADPAYGLSPDDTADFPDAFLNQDLVAGRRLGFVAQRSAGFLLYNEAWARRLGFSDPPANEKEFREQACAAHAELTLDDDLANDAEGGWLVSTDALTFLTWMTAFGGGPLDGDGYRFLSPRNLEAAVFLKQLYDDGCAWLPAAGSDSAAAFADRRALFASAALEGLSGQTRALATAENADSWTVLPYPGPSQPGLITYGSSFILLKSSPEEQLASWLFIRWMLSPDHQKRWVEATGLFPLRGSELELLGDYAKSHPQWAAALDNLAHAQIQPQLSSWRQVRVMIGDGFDAMFRSNTPAGRVAEILAIMDRTASDLTQ